MFFGMREEAFKLVDAQLLKGYGDKKFEKAVDINTRKTKILGLNIFPTRICRSDVIVVLKTAFDFLASLEDKDHNYFSVSALIVKYKGVVIPLRNLCQI